jgi:hypothetical protein
MHQLRRTSCACMTYGVATQSMAVLLKKRWFLSLCGWLQLSGVPTT